MQSSPYTVQEVTADVYTTSLHTIERALAAPVSFLQAPLYGHLQRAHSKTVVYLTAHRGSTPVACAIAIRYTAPGGLRFLYCPYGPIALEWTAELLGALRDFFGPIAQRLGCAFVRLDANELVTASVATAIPDKMARTASLQPRAEWLLDISADRETIWKGFHKHARYNIRLAERADAVTKTFSPSAAPLDDFFTLMNTTAERDGFRIFDRSYYEAYLQSMTNDDGFVTVCYLGGRPAAAGLFVVHDAQSHYVFAGSSNDYRKIAPAYTVIWHAIRASQEHGCAVFNFGGVSDSVKGQAWSGVTSFKKRFGGYRVEHANPVDLVYKPLHYTAFRLYKTFRS